MKRLFSILLLFAVLTVIAPACQTKTEGVISEPTVSDSVTIEVIDPAIAVDSVEIPANE